VCEDDIPESNEEDGLESVRAIETAYQTLQTGAYLHVNPGSPMPVSSVNERKFYVLSSGKASSTA
jgi:hypothetical protein